MKFVIIVIIKYSFYIRVFLNNEYIFIKMLMKEFNGFFCVNN